jgi:hypothetical protein
VTPHERVARRVGLPVVGKHLRIDFAAVLPPLAAEQVAELTAELQAALGHDPRRDRRVVVRREVEVVGQRELDAARARRSCRRHEEATLALVGERELEPRRVEDRCAEEAHGRVMRGADHPVRVEVELVRLQVPILARRDAARVPAIRDVIFAGPFEADLAGVAACAGLADAERRRLERSGLRSALVCELGAGMGPARRKHHVAGRVHPSLAMS